MKSIIHLLHIVLFVMCTQTVVHAQEIQWTQIDTISESVIGGQLLPESKGNRFQRLPNDMQSKVRPVVWNLSKQSAGEYIEFYSNSPKILVNYEVTEELNMYHFATTGVSGVDLYMKGKNGEWFWAPAQMEIGKSIQSTFANLDIEKGQRFRLYLPLYNHVTSMKIGVDADKYFRIIPQHLNHPIVIYGTSIAQGACASRAGLAWTNMLGRRLDRAIVNLGFSGNGRLEKPLIDFILKTPVSLIVLDCLPNLSGTNYTQHQVYDSIVNVVQTIRAKTNTPILFVQHSGGNDKVYNLNQKRNREYAQVQQPLDSALKFFQQEGMKAIHLLKAIDFQFDNESTVDGIHPNDIGMQQMANAYEKSIRAILNLFKGELSTTQPVQQFREYPGYDWLKRHHEVMAFNKKSQPKLVILGNSILHFWAGNPKAPYVRGAASWEKYIAPFEPVNMGFGWDRIENMLWRVENGELDDFNAEKIMIMAGTNNLSVNDTDENILLGLQTLIHQIQIRQPNAQIYLSGIFPRRAYEERIQMLNQKIKLLATMPKIHYFDTSALWLLKSDKINEKLFSDGLHPNEEGYEKFGKALYQILKN